MKILLIGRHLDSDIAINVRMNYLFLYEKSEGYHKTSIETAMPPGPRRLHTERSMRNPQAKPHSLVHLVLFHLHSEVLCNLPLLAVRDVVIEHEPYGRVLTTVGCSVPVTVGCGWRQWVVRSPNICVLGMSAILWVSIALVLSWAVFPVRVPWDAVFTCFLVEWNADG
jgi:hypothetical protein